MTLSLRTRGAPAAPGGYPPGLEPPGLEPPGLEPPGLEPPGLEPPGLEPPGRVPGRLLRVYGVLLGPLLAGYLLFDKAFAYIRLPGTPLYIGEMFLVLGTLAILGATGYLRLPLSEGAGPGRPGRVLRVGADPVPARVPGLRGGRGPRLRPRLLLPVRVPGRGRDGEIAGPHGPVEWLGWPGSSRFCCRGSWPP